MDRKAHFAGKPLVSTYIYTKYSTEKPNPDINKYEGPFDQPVSKYSDNKEYQEWCLINSTPAACADIGIHHLYRHTKTNQLIWLLAVQTLKEFQQSLHSC